MKIKYRDKEKIREILNRDHNNNYADIGFLVVWKPFLMIFILLIAGLVIGTIISIFRFGIN